MEPTPTRRRLGALPLAVAIGLVATGVAQTVTIVRHEPTPPVLLRLDVEEGLTVSYRMEMEMDGRISAGLFRQPLEVTMIAEQDWVVEEVGEDGSATIAIDTRLIDATSPEGEIPRSDLEGVEGRTTMRLAADGTILDAAPGVTGSITGPASIPGLEGFGPTFPEEPVAPGDRWDLSMDLPLLPDGPSLHVTGEARLDGYEEVMGIRSAVIDAEARMPFDFQLDVSELAEELGESFPEEEIGGTIVYEGEMTMSSRQWVDPETGLQVRMEGGGEADFAFSFAGLPQGGDTPPVPRTNLEFELAMTLDRL